MTNITNYPLCWPHHIKGRTPATERKYGSFGVKGPNGYKTNLTVSQSVRRVMDEISKFTRVGHPHVIDPHTVVISTNIRVRLDGLPKSGQKKPEDPGAAVYFDMHGEPCCFPCDTYITVQDNLAAIAAHFDAKRCMQRHGVGDLRAEFSGYAALPSNVSVEWWQVLQVDQDAPRSAVEKAFRKLRSTHHTDKGGNADQFQAVQDAWKSYCDQ